MRSEKFVTDNLFFKPLFGNRTFWQRRFGKKNSRRFGYFFMPKRPVLYWFCFWFSTNWLGPVCRIPVCRILELKKNDKTINVRMMQSLCLHFYSVCIDLSKAFDSVSHQIWLEKLNLIGFNDDALELIFSFLSHRSQQVVINNTVSDITETYQGVPQGTVLGPLLFNIYINDITKNISEECRIIQYADDCLIYSANPKPDIAIENLQICLEKLENLFRSNQLTLNASKTEFIRFSTPKITVSNSQLIVAGSNIKLKNEVK